VYELPFKQDSEGKERDGMKWIAVKDRLPDTCRLCVVFAESLDYDAPYIHMGLYWDGKWLTNLQPFASGISHWMELPKPPADRPTREEVERTEEDG